MTTEDDMARDPLADLELCGRATEGPWFAETFQAPGVGVMWDVSHDTGRPGDLADRYSVLEDLSRDDAAFIAAARTGWPAALRRLLAAEARIKELECEIAGWQKAMALLNTGFESTCEDRDRLKQDNRRLTAEIETLKGKGW